jgi:serine/threonine-protein kinase ATR
VPEFIRHTLSETLPRFIIQRDRPVLNYIKNTLGERISALVFGLAAELLARIFLLQDSTATDQALAFALDLLNENTGQQRVTLESLILSCDVPLLTELVIAFHSEDREIHSLVRFPLIYFGALTEDTQVIDGFRRVQVATSQSPSRKTRSPNQDVATKEFVTANMLAIMMRLSEFLHDMYGKKPVEMKRQIIGGIAPFISYVGSAISGIGLQVSFPLSNHGNNV